MTGNKGKPHKNKTNPHPNYLKLITELTRVPTDTYKLIQRFLLPSCVKASCNLALKMCLTTFFLNMYTNCDTEMCGSLFPTAEKQKKPTFCQLKTDIITWIFDIWMAFFSLSWWKQVSIKMLLLYLIINKKLFSIATFAGFLSLTKKKTELKFDLKLRKTTITGRSHVLLFVPAF